MGISVQPGRLRPAGAVAVGCAVLATMLCLVGAQPGYAATGCTIKGTSGADVLRGTAGGDVICGGGGNDRIFGGDGDDIILPGQGNDVVGGGPGNDRIVDDGGLDVLNGGVGSDVIRGGSGRDTLDGGAGPGVDTVFGGDGNDAIFGRDGDDVLNGGAGADALTGGPGNDRVYGGYDPDAILGGGGSDTLVGGGGNDHEHGGRGPDTIDGDDGNDHVVGGGDSDTVDGGTGNDHLYGGEEHAAVRICHWAGNTAGPAGGHGIYVLITIDDDGLHGHDDHRWDVFALSSGACPGVGGSDPPPGTDGDDPPPPPTDGDDTLTGGGGTDPCEGGGGDDTFDGCGDVTAPKLLAFDFTPTSVDTSGGPAQITVTAHIADDISGNILSGSMAIFRSPSGQLATAQFGSFWRQSGTDLDGEYSYTIDLPQHAESGTWTIREVQLRDQVQNMRLLQAADLVASGFPTSFEQVGPGDGQPPAFVSLRLDQRTVDTSAGDVVLTVTFHVTDNESGVKHLMAWFSGPDEQQFVAFGPADEQHPDLGTPLDGVYVATATLPRYSKQGQWGLTTLLAIDEAGNGRNLKFEDVMGDSSIDSTFMQVGEGDATPPMITSLAISPAQVTVTDGPATIGIDAHIVDDISGVPVAGHGVAIPSIRFRSPSGQFLAGYLSSDELQSGTLLDGTYHYDMTVPQFSETGIWKVYLVTLHDSVRNTRYVPWQGLQDLGMPYSFEVVCPPT